MPSIVFIIHCYKGAAEIIGLDYLRLISTYFANIALILCGTKNPCENVLCSAQCITLNQPTYLSSMLAPRANRYRPESLDSVTFAVPRT